MSKMDRGRPGRRPGQTNTKSMVVKLALNKLNFDVIEEYVAAYRELEDPKDKIVALNALMKYTHPQLKEMDYDAVRKLEMEEELHKLAIEGKVLNPSTATTEELLDAFNAEAVEAVE